jgi:hypothetical protein
VPIDDPIHGLAVLLVGLVCVCAPPAAADDASPREAGAATPSPRDVGKSAEELSNASNNPPLTQLQLRDIVAPRLPRI